MKIIICNCKHAFQDNLYGKFHRVATTSTKLNKVVYRCTVCGKEQ